MILVSQRVDENNVVFLHNAVVNKEQGLTCNSSSISAKMPARNATFLFNKNYIKCIGFAILY